MKSILLPLDGNIEGTPSYFPQYPSQHQQSHHTENIQ